MESLPVGVMVHIFSFLKVKEKCIAASVCRSWYHLVREKQLWKHVDLTNSRVNLQATWKIIRCYFTDALQTLRLRGFNDSIKKTECISNAVLINLCERCPNIHELYIKDANLTNIDSGNFPPTLKVLILYKCQTTFGWCKSAVEQGRFDQLQNLDVTRSIRFCNDDLMHLAELPQGGKLECLNFSYCYRISTMGFMSMAEQLTNLIRLDVTNTCIFDDDLHYICRNLKKLEVLILQGCDSLTDLCMGSLATLHKLHHLDISGSEMKISGDSLIQLMAKLKQLEELYVSLSAAVTDADLEQITGRSVKCRIITK